MATRTVIAIVSLAGVSTCGLISTLVFYQMVDAVNGLLPEAQRFSSLGWYWPKYQRLKTEYKRLYPEGNLLRRVHALTALMFVCLLTCAWALGFFR